MVFPPLSKLDRLKVEQCGPQDVLNNGPNHHQVPDQPQPQQQNQNQHQPQHQAPDQPVPQQQQQQPPEQQPQPPAEPQGTEQGSTGSVGGGSLERELQRPLQEEERRQRDAERYGFQTDGSGDWDRPPLTKITGTRMQPPQQPANGGPHHALQSSPAQLNGTGAMGDRVSPGAELGNGLGQRAGAQTPMPEPQRALQRTNSMQQLEQWVRTQRVRCQDDDTRR